jgi:hypothetical protein
MWYNSVMTPKLTEEQRQAIRQHPGEPVPIEDEESHERFYLVSEELLSNRHVNRDALRQAILARRDESRQRNDEWEHADRDVWEHSTET